MKAISLTLAGLAVVFASGCTVHQTETPALSGPSEFALSLSVSAAPDTISQDGRSNATVAVLARDVNGRPIANAPFRFDIVVDGGAADYGTLSSRNVVTGSDGRATAVYTAPPAAPAGSTAGACSGNILEIPTAGRCVQIVATSVSTDYYATEAHSALIHLIPVGIILPAGSTPVPSFVMTPATPTANDTVQFDASKSCGGSVDSTGGCPATSSGIVSYAWSFGDGATGVGRTASHVFSRQQTYLITLTVTNDVGVSASSTQSLNVGAGTLPTPAFVFSPTAPLAAQSIYFDASTSKPGGSHRLVRFVFNWGDGSTMSDSSSPTASHAYAANGTYVVTLTVADDTGQTASVTGTVKVGP
jgi:PKD repeat protein